MATHQFHQVIPTYLLLNHFDLLERQIISQVRNCTDFNTHLELVGQLKLLKILSNLPETLTILEQEVDNATSQNP